jgi:enamine deaminase RidA (YjgF/YER057c/UK114 family)
MTIEEKLAAKGLTLPTAPKPVAAYVPAVAVDGYVYTAGQIPLVNGELKFKGKVGKDLDEAQGYEAAKTCVLNCLSVIKDQIGSLDKIAKVVKVVGFVNSAPGFTGQPKIINGASELLGELFGENGKHARSAVGVSELPLGAACEVELVVKVK